MTNPKAKKRKGKDRKEKAKKKTASSGGRSRKKKERPPAEQKKTVLSPRRGAAKGRASIEYSAACPCGFRRGLKYGRSKEGTIYEIFACPECRELFSLKFSAKLQCPRCSCTGLVSYNPHKEENLKFYKTEYKAHQLDRNTLQKLEEFWDTIKENECPRCGKQTLRWKNK